MIFNTGKDINEFVLSKLPATKALDLDLIAGHHVVTREVVDELQSYLLDNEANLQYVGYGWTTINGLEAKSYSFRAINDEELVCLYVIEESE